MTAVAEHPPTPRGARRLACALGLLLTPPLGAVAFAAAGLTAASVTDTPALLIAAATLAWLAATYLGSRLSLWIGGVTRHHSWALGIGGVGTVVLLMTLRATILTPLIPVDQQFAIHLPGDVEVWPLASGSRVAVRKVDGRGRKRAHPIVFLHGGPGGYSVSLQPTVEAIGRLSEDGYDVYFYDQVGGGLSARLDDIHDYTLERHLTDLDGIYHRIGAEQIILIGSSWGASMGAGYMARHPQHVAAAVFSGAGPMYHPSWVPGGDGGLDERLTSEQAEGFARLVETPRLMTALLLAEINPGAAVRFASEWELGSLFDKVANTFYLPLAVCDPRDIDVSSAGYGFWSNRMTGRSLRAQTQDPRPSLRQNLTPVLILRGECDYKREAVALEYANVFANAQFARFANAGHMLYWEQPDAFLKRVRQFLTTAVSNP
ncbi:MAG: alpha/beta fold hydrolase [Pseudomonadota bacterium]